MIFCVVVHFWSICPWNCPSMHQCINAACCWQFPSGKFVSDGPGPGPCVTPFPLVLGQTLAFKRVLQANQEANHQPKLHVTKRSMLLCTQPPLTLFPPPAFLLLQPLCHQHPLFVCLVWPRNGNLHAVGMTSKHPIFIQTYSWSASWWSGVPQRLFSS